MGGTRQFIQMVSQIVISMYFQAVISIYFQAVFSSSNNVTTSSSHASKMYFQLYVLTRSYTFNRNDILARSYTFNGNDVGAHHNCTTKTRSKVILHTTHRSTVESKKCCRVPKLYRSPLIGKMFNSAQAEHMFFIVDRYLFSEQYTPGDYDPSS